ncbi:MAG TPA: protein phosphatase 2C domain-containing protein [Streptosporangiaceae bacterium]|nr:protein phosphatase 2C domain-containing protein [Streptosporangiaceae bacterium]
MTLALHYALRSDVGLLREGNEDSAYAGPRLLAIADGMGGHAAGEVASAVAISAIAPLDLEGLSDGGEMLDALAAAVASARSTLHEMSEEDPATEGMGTTLTALLWAVPHVAICHIGDSRAYLLRDGDLYQITRDHTLIQSLVDEGRLSPAAAANHPQRSLIMRALQGSTDADPDLTMHEALLGDRYLLCSDGLTDVVSDEAVHETLVTVEDADQAVRQLIAQAIRNGGPDNITCIVADVVDSDGSVPPTTDRVLAGAAANPDAKSLLSRKASAPEASVTGSAPPASANGYHARADDEDDLDADDGPRRRWPVVTSVFVVLVLLIVGGLFVGWRFTQGQYYVDTDGSHVVIYRGISDQIGGLHLSSVYKRTSIPVQAVPADLQLPTSPGSLATAQRTINSLQRTYTTTCQQAHAAQAAWVAKYKTPAQPKTSKSKGKTTTPPPPPPEPTVPGYCPALGAG